MSTSQAFDSAISGTSGINSSSQKLLQEGVSGLLTFSDHAYYGAALVSCDSIL